MLRHLTKFTVSFSEHRAPTLCSVKEIERWGEGLHPWKSSVEGESLRSKVLQITCKILWPRRAQVLNYSTALHCKNRRKVGLLKDGETAPQMFLFVRSLSLCTFPSTVSCPGEITSRLWHEWGCFSSAWGCPHCSSPDTPFPAPRLERSRVTQGGAEASLFF